MIIAQLKALIEGIKVSKLLVSSALVILVLLSFLWMIKSLADKQYQRGLTAGRLEMTNQQLIDLDAVRRKAAEDLSKVQAERDKMRLELQTRDGQLDDALQKALDELKVKDPNVAQCLGMPWPASVRKHQPRLRE